MDGKKVSTVPRHPGKGGFFYTWETIKGERDLFVNKKNKVNPKRNEKN